MKLRTLMSIAEIAAMYKSGQLELNPSFQRDSVWSIRERLLLVDSIMKDYPLPAVFLCRRKDGHRTKIDVIDGKQRIESALYFMGMLQGEHSLFSGKIKDRNAEIEQIEYAWKNFDRAQRKRFRDYRFTVIPVGGDPSRVEKIFVRINSTGKALSEGEILKAKYLTKPLFQSIRRFAADRSTLNLLERLGVVTKVKRNRLADVLLLAEITMTLIKGGLLDKKRALDEMLNEKADRLTSCEVERYLKFVQGALKWAEAIWKSDGHGGIDFRDTRFRKSSDFYSLIVLLADYLKDKYIPDNKDSNQAIKRELMKLDQELRRYRISVREGARANAVTGLFAEYRRSVQANADGISQRRIRRDVLDGLMRKCLCKKDSRRSFTKDERLFMKLQDIAKNGVLTCYLCGEPIDDSRDFCCRDSYTLDHVKAHKCGGLSVLGNARPAHRSCNSKKGARAVKREHHVVFDFHGASAEGVYNYYSGRLVVRKGAYTSLDAPCRETKARIRELVKAGVLRRLKDCLKFRQDYKCSPSEAAVILSGLKACNGRHYWHLKDGTPIGDI